MDTVTYPQPSVIDLVTQTVIPVRVPFDSQPLSTQFNVQWTPTLITLDPEGKEHHRTVGFLPPEEFIPSVLLGVAKCAFDSGALGIALAHLERILADHPNSSCAPEAVYLRGVSRFKTAHEPRHLKEAYETLAAQYPGSEWERRAYPYRLL